MRLAPRQSRGGKRFQAQTNRSAREVERVRQALLDQTVARLHAFPPRQCQNLAGHVLGAP